MVPSIIQNQGPWLRSIAQGHTAEQRPSFSQNFDNTTGEITVNVPQNHLSKLKKVELVFAETIQSERRDFRWGVKGPDDGVCKKPYLPVPKGLISKMHDKYQSLSEDMTMCLQPIVWLSQKIKET